MEIDANRQQAAGVSPAIAGEHAALSKMMIAKLMPLLVIVYVISFLDRTNIALAKQSMGVDLGISAAAYGLGAGLFFLTYALFEIPSNLVMHKVGARFWITRIMITWGLLSVGMAFVGGTTSFYVMRLLLGIAEAGLFPGVLLYLTYWFSREEQARAIGYFLLGVCFANIVGGPLGGALLELNGMMGLHGWQWLFILEGLPAVVLAFVVWKVLPDGPASAPWLTPEQAAALTRRLTAEREAQSGKGHGAHSFGRVLGDKQVWLAIFIYFCHQLTIYTTIFFLPVVPSTVAVGDPATLLKQRPDIRSAERKLAAMNAQIGEQIAGYFPKLTLYGELGYSATNPSHLVRKSNASWLGVPYLSWNFLDFGRTHSKVKEAEAQRDEAEATYRGTVLAALRDADSALSRYGHQRDNVGQLLDVEASANRSAALVDQRYRAGTSTLIDLLDAERSQLSAKQNVVNGQAQLVQDFVSIQKSLGLGWQAQ